LQPFPNASERLRDPLTLITYNICGQQCSLTN
jgi:hypothetical protein